MEWSTDIEGQVMLDGDHRKEGKVDGGDLVVTGFFFLDFSIMIDLIFLVLVQCLLPQIFHDSLASLARSSVSRPDKTGLESDMVGNQRVGSRHGESARG